MNNSSITFVTGCAISQSNFYLTSNLDSLDTWDLFSKTFIYKHQSNEWVGIDLDGWKVISVAFFENSGVSSLLALEQDGDLGIFQENKNRLQKIREIDDSKIQGQFNRIRVIDNLLYVCGDGSQIYVNHNEDWRALGIDFSEEVLNIPKTDELNMDLELSFDINLYDINGFNSNDIYICGIKKNEGFISYYNGSSWNVIERITPSPLYGITICPDKENIIISGAYGTLIKGNFKDGFKNLKNISINSTFYSTAYYKDKLYIASEDGLYIYAEGIYQLVDAIKDIKGITSIEEKEGILWVLSYKKLIRFNGEVWERITHPLNDPIDHQFTNNVRGREHCPRSGYWYTTAKKNSRRFFNQGDIFPDFESDWGDVYWQFDGED